MRNRDRKTLPLKKALDLLRQNGHLLMLMHEWGGGQEYYIIPGGHVDRKDAETILARPDVFPSHDGLFPESSQTWRMGDGS
jgi:hypothetical protein